MPGLAIDVALLVVLGALVAGVVGLAQRWEAPIRQAVEIDLSPSALPVYTLLSLSRGFAAYLLSLAFTLVYGTIAAHGKRAEKIMLPLLDIGQGIPVLGFLPGLVLGMVALFPRTNVGLELACIVMIFTGQVWNMTFSYIGSLRSIPGELHEVARLHRFSFWKRFRTVEVSSSVIGLVWNSMMSMAGGWFFLTVNEAFTLGDRDFRLPGIGSYMAVAIEKGDSRAMAWAIVAMVVMIVACDQILWRPLVAWSQRFRNADVEGEAGAPILGPGPRAALGVPQEAAPPQAAPRRQATRAPAPPRASSPSRPRRAEASASGRALSPPSAPAALARRDPRGVEARGAPRAGSLRRMGRPGRRPRRDVPAGPSRRSLSRRPGRCRSGSSWAAPPSGRAASSPSSRSWRRFRPRCSFRS